MIADDLARLVLSTLLLGLRIVPIFAFAPPFTLTRAPRLVRMLIGLGLALCLVVGNPRGTQIGAIDPGTLILIAARELAFGATLALAFQIVFAALLTAGRTLDIQAGFGLAVLIDPTTRAQLPLVGTLFVYAAGSVFFAMGGHHELLRTFAASIDAVPLGAWRPASSLNPIAGFIGTAFLVAFGIAGAAILGLFLIDLGIALLSRTIPQMNVLVLGFQVKTIALLLLLPLSFGIMGALFFRLMALMIAALPRVA